MEVSIGASFWRFENYQNVKVTGFYLSAENRRPKRRSLISRLDWTKLCLRPFGNSRKVERSLDSTERFALEGVDGRSKVSRITPVPAARKSCRLSDRYAVSEEWTPHTGPTWRSVGAFGSNHQWAFGYTQNSRCGSLRDQREANAVLAEASEGCRRIAESTGKSGAHFDWAGLKSIDDLSGIPESWGVLEKSQGVTDISRFREFSKRGSVVAARVASFWRFENYQNVQVPPGTWVWHVLLALREEINDKHLSPRHCCRWHFVCSHTGQSSHRWKNARYPSINVIPTWTSLFPKLEFRSV